MGMKGTKVWQVLRMLSLIGEKRETIYVWCYLNSMSRYVFRTKEILSRERQWRTRSSILQSTGKHFAKNIMAILNSVKMREEGKYSKAAPPVAGGPPTSRPGQPPAVPRQPLPGYNRLIYYFGSVCLFILLAYISFPFSEARGKKWSPFLSSWKTLTNR